MYISTLPRSWNNLILRQYKNNTSDDKSGLNTIGTLAHIITTKLVIQDTTRSTDL